jgi:hypothetical protein
MVRIHHCQAANAVGSELISQRHEYKMATFSNYKYPSTYGAICLLSTLNFLHHLTVHTLILHFSPLSRAPWPIQPTLSWTESTRCYLKVPEIRLPKIKQSKSTVKLSRNRPWRPIGLWNVKDPILSRQSTHRWRTYLHFYSPPYTSK